MNVLIIGGTGFIGYHACRQLVSRGHHVTLVGLPPEPPAGLFPEQVDILLDDINSYDDSALQRLFITFETVIFAAGVDDRAVPDGSADLFFYRENVLSTVRLVSTAMKSWVSRFIVLGSYFSYFDREWVELDLAGHNPYVMSRRQQQELGAAIAGHDMEFAVLELPYIFGAMPGKIPLWQPLVDYVRSGVELFYSNGGSNMIAVERVAEAIVGAVERPDIRGNYTVGDRNVSWVEFLQGLCAAAGREDSKVRIVNDDTVHNLSWVGDAFFRLHGKESGLTPSNFSRVQTAYTYFDPAASQRALGYSGGGLERAWQDTVDACPQRRRLKTLSHYIARTKKTLGY